MTHCGNNGDEELRAVGARPAVGHAECVRTIVSQRGVKLVLELSSPDALAPHAGAGGVSGLNHEALRTERSGNDALNESADARGTEQNPP